MSTITRTYSVGDKGKVRRLDNLAGAWVDIGPVTNLVIPSIPSVFSDVETDPADGDKVCVVGHMATNAFGPNFYGIAVSSDAGATWNQPYHLTGGDYSTLYSSVGPSFIFYEVSVVDTNTIYACGDKGWVVKSTDGGLSFNKCTQLPAITLYGPAGTPAPPASLYPVTALHFITPTVGVVACGGNVFKTIDGGVSWIHLNGGQPIANGSTTFRGIGSGIFISQDNQTIVCLNYSTTTTSNIVRSTDGGVTWSEVFVWAGASIDTLTGLHLTWTDDLHLWGFSQFFGRIRSIDGGATWTYLEFPHTGTPSKNDLAGHFYNNTDGFYSEARDVSQTLDGGVISKIPSETAPYVVNALWTTPASVPPVCYLLTDCAGNQTPFVTNTDLSAYVGQTIETCINTTPQQGPPRSPLALISCYKLTNCCDPSQVTLIRKPPDEFGFPNLTGQVMTFPLIYPNICWSVVEESCQNNPIPPDPLITSWWNNSANYTVFTDCALCTSAIGFPCPVPLTYYTFTSCCSQQAVRIETSNNLSALVGSVVTVGGTIIPELGTECWTVTNWISGGPSNPSVFLNTAINIITSYPNTGCSDPVCTAACLPAWPDGCYCATVSIAPNCTGSAPWPGEIFATHPDCQTCLGICYLLTDCSGVLAPITVSNDLSEFVGQIVQFTDCGDTCWSVAVALSCDNSVCVTAVSASFADCVTCLPPVVPIPPEPLHPRRIKPGYYTAGCDPAYTERINCTFAEAVYDKMVKLRYGITICCDEDIDKWDIKKQELDLRALYDPTLCKSTLPTCCPPCDVRVLITRLICPAPESVQASFSYGPCTLWTATGPNGSSSTATTRNCDNTVVRNILSPGQTITLCALEVLDIPKGTVTNTGIACS